MPGWGGVPLAMPPGHAQGVPHHTMHHPTPGYPSAPPLPAAGMALWAQDGEACAGQGSRGSRKQVKQGEAGKQGKQGKQGKPVGRNEVIIRP